MDEAQSENLFPRRVGERLAEARQKKKLDLSDVATRTRIPQRHLEAIEEGRYGDLPAATYAVGFAKSYARAIDIDEVAIAHDMRAELDLNVGKPAAPEFFEPADPARVPTRTLAWTAAAIGLVLVAGYALVSTQSADELGGRDPTEVAAGIGDAPAAPAQAPRSAATGAIRPASGAVVLAATDAVWLRVTDSGGARLLEKEMAAGERWEVPADARDPRIVTGRPDKIQVTVGGQPVPPLGPPETTIRDVAISAAALAQRPAAPASPGPFPPTGQP